MVSAEWLMGWTCAFLTLSSSTRASKLKRAECHLFYLAIKIMKVYDYNTFTKTCESFNLKVASPRYVTESEALQSLYVIHMHFNPNIILMLAGRDPSDVNAFRNPDGWLLHKPHFTNFKKNKPVSSNNKTCLGYQGQDLKWDELSCAPTKYSSLYVACEACVVGNMVFRFNILCVCKTMDLYYSQTTCKDGCLPVSILRKIPSVTPCRKDRYGPDCLRQCHCKDGKPCDINTGACPEGCKPDWTGLACNETRCPLGKWGQSCEHFCFCRLNQQCVAQTGLCEAGCDEGLGGRKCLSPRCSPTKFGPKCDRHCHCKPGVVCSSVDGRCARADGCAANWIGPYCNETKCPAGSYGRNCQNYCKCKYKSQCDFFTGQCYDGCEGLWIGGQCNRTKCKVGTYGETCSVPCQCEKGVPCDQNYGECLGEHVVNTPACDEPKAWGYDCNNTCIDANCLRCMKFAGEVCLVCDGGYALPGNRVCLKEPTAIPISQRGSGYYALLALFVMVFILAVSLMLYYVVLRRRATEQDQAEEDAEEVEEEEPTRLKASNEVEESQEKDNAYYDEPSDDEEETTDDNDY